MLACSSHVAARAGKYVPAYIEHSSGNVQTHPPPGTLSLASVLQDKGHPGVDDANAFLSHASHWEPEQKVLCVRVGVIWGRGVVAVLHNCARASGTRHELCTFGYKICAPFCRGVVVL